MERVVRELSEGLAAEGHTVRVLAACVKNEGGGLSTDGGVEIVRLKTSAHVLSQPIVAGLAQEIREFSPDVVHFHLPNPLALLSGWSRNIPTALTLHAEPSGLRRHIDRAITKTYAARADALVFSSLEMATRWTTKENLAEGGKAHVIPFGFRFDYLRPTGAQSVPRLALTVGRLVGYKGIDRLLEAMTMVEGKLLIVGDGPCRQDLQRLAGKLDLGEKVSFLGTIPDADLSSCYEQCSIYVQPSISSAEGFGIAMLEAMSFAKPVVSSDLPTGVKRVNVHGLTGLSVPPADPRALAAAMNRLFSQPSWTRDLGRRAREHQQGFSHAKMVRDHIELYQRLALRNRPLEAPVS